MPTNLPIALGPVLNSNVLMNVLSAALNIIGGIATGHSKSFALENYRNFGEI